MSDDQTSHPPLIAPGNDLVRNDDCEQPATEQQRKENATEVYESNPFFEYRNLVGSISERLRKDNALRLAYVYGLPSWYYEVGPTYDPSSSLRILIALEGKGVFAPNNLSGLTKALETVEREDLAQTVRDFRKLSILVRSGSLLYC